MNKFQKIAFKLINSNTKYFRLFLILINDLFIINISLYFSYLVRIEYLINIIEIKNIFLFSNFLYLSLFFVFKIHKQYFRYFNYNSNRSYTKPILVKVMK